MIRIQRRRSKGWRMPPDAMIVSRPSRWANPYRVGAPFSDFDPRPMTTLDVVRRYRGWLYERMKTEHDFLEPLRGHDLACWCDLRRPCHVDAILDWFELHPLIATADTRPVLGIHRQPEADAETAPAWPSMAVARQRWAAFRRGGR